MELEDLFDGQNIDKFDLPATGNTFHPYPNKNSFLLGDWQWNHGNQKSKENFSELLHIVGSPEFKPDDVRHTQWDKIDATLGSNEFDGKTIADGDGNEWTDEDAVWKKSTVKISVPFHSRGRSAKNPGPKDYTVGDLYHRSLVSVIREKISNAQDNPQFHYEPFELLWQRDNHDNPLRVYSELYTSSAYLTAHQEVQELPGKPGCELPRVVAAMMFWSDATHLTSFGTAKLWPCYLFFGNESKYRRCKPTCNLCNHVAYFQTVTSPCPIPSMLYTETNFQLPDAFKDFTTENIGRGASKELMAHCHREVLHAQWSILIDEEFLDAYKHGIVIECCDGIWRRFYPHILTYSADYPEKYVPRDVNKLILDLYTWNAEYSSPVSATMHDAHVLDVSSQSHGSRILGWCETCNSGRLFVV